MLKLTFHYFSLSIEPYDKKIRFEIFIRSVIEGSSAVYTSFVLTRNECMNILNEIDSFINDKGISDQTTAALDIIEMNYDKLDNDTICILSITPDNVDATELNIQIMFKGVAELQNFSTSLSQVIKKL